jgi:hypothetical protein
MHIHMYTNNTHHHKYTKLHILPCLKRVEGVDLLKESGAVDDGH